MSKILIVDDIPQNLYMLRFLLERQGHEVETANNGQEALEKARLALPDLIVTDILMPVMDGFTLCREWQNDSQLNTIPFVFYTATYTDEKDAALGLSLGAARFIVKPMEPKALYAILDEVITAHEAGRLVLPQVEQEEEPIFLKQYNERLIKKLEDKMMQLEEVNQRLEQEVAARTAELTVALEEARAADRLKSQLISDVNHELRTPLNNLMLYLGLLEIGLPEKRPHYINVVYREAERLQWLISQLLDLSRLDAGKIATNLEPVDVNQLASTLVTDRHRLVQESGLKLDFELDADLPLASADPQLLFQILTNLLTNAINYTPQGGLVIVRTSRQQRNDQEWVTVMVEDTGLGISEADQVHLFERFFRGKSADEMQAPGTGLGLSICRELIDRLGGDITVQSELGQGSIFTLWLQPITYGV